MSMKSNGDVSAEEAKAYLESRGRRRGNYGRDWPTILRRIMAGESQDAIAKELKTTSSQLSNGLKRYAERVLKRETEQ